MRRRWEDMLAELAAFKARHGHCNVPTADKHDARLGRWVAAQRFRRRVGELAREHEARLDELGFVWSPSDVAWDTMFAQLEAYRQHHGDCNVPERYPENQKLANWVHSQRHRHRRGKLSPQRLKRLNALGFCWSVYRVGEEDAGKVGTAERAGVQAELLRVVPPPPQERLYAIRHGVYCQFNGEGEPPAMLAGYLRNNGGRLPPYIPLPTRHVIFILGNGFVGERRVKWTGTGTLPEAVMAFVIENGTLPRHELSTASGS